MPKRSSTLPPISLTSMDDRTKQRKVMVLGSLKHTLRGNFNMILTAGLTYYTPGVKKASIRDHCRSDKATLKGAATGNGVSEDANRRRTLKTVIVVHCPCLVGNIQG